MTDSEEAIKDLLRKSEFQRKFIVWAFVFLYCGFLAYQFTEFQAMAEDKEKKTAAFLREHKLILNPDLKEVEETNNQPFLVKIDDDSPK